MQELHIQPAEDCFVSVVFNDPDINAFLELFATIRRLLEGLGFSEPGLGAEHSEHKDNDRSSLIKVHEEHSQKLSDSVRSRSITSNGVGTPCDEGILEVEAVPSKK